MVTDVIRAIDETLCVQDSEGHTLIGQGNALAGSSSIQKSLIVAEDQVIGWVMGSAKAETAARLLSQMACRELEKRTLTQELLNKYKEITLLFRLSEQIVETIDIEQVAHLLLGEARQILPSEGGMLMILREATGTLEKIAAFETENHTTESNDSQKAAPRNQQTTNLQEQSRQRDHPLNGNTHQAVQLGEGLIGKITASGRGEIVSQVTGDPRNLETCTLQCSDLICVPLKLKDRIIGVIALYRMQPQPYRSEDLKLLTTLCAYAASVISVLTHERQLKESRQNELILQLSNQVRTSLDLSETIQTAVNKIQLALQCDRCFFVWHHPALDTSLPISLTTERPQTEHFEIVSESKNPSLLPMTGTYELETIGHDVVEQLYRQEVVQIDDASQMHLSPLRLFLQSYSCAALLAFPMMTRAGQLGLLCCSTSQPRSWENEEVKLLQAVTNHLVIAVDQAELYEKSQLDAQLAKDKAKELAQALDYLKNMQLQLVHTEKMSSLGRMVAGIAHEINNPVTFIHGNLNHLNKGVSDILELIESYESAYPTPSQEIVDIAEDIDLPFLQDDLPKLLSSINTGTERIQQIVLSLRNFAQLDQADIKQVDIHDGLESTLLLLQHRFKPEKRGATIALTKYYGQLPKVECYAKQMNQVFISLLSNALDALEQSHVETPTITLTTEYRDPYIYIHVGDNGPGIPKEIQPQLFDPFFTTKDVGEGSGLGLAVSYQIVVEQHRGEFSLSSSQGQGTTFIVKIPAVLKAASSSSLSAQPVSSASPPLNHRPFTSLKHSVQNNKPF
ncbi:MAG: GAF domain-containing protein [Cyanobacteria bacterium J06627_28]